jgi:phosphoserine phosphatase RsbU/P
MASLQIVKGPNQGATVPLTGERFVIGRNPDCGIVIPVTSVSREHAQITTAGGKYFIEDLQSRNGTFVNNQAISGRTPLRHQDKVRICDFQAVFLHTLPADEEDEAEEGGSTTVEATLSATGSNLLLETQPAEKLRAYLDISSSLAKTLQLDALLPQIVDRLFQLFKQADRGFVILGEEGSPRLMPKVVKTRRAQDEPNARFSRSIVRQCLQTANSFLSDDATQDNRVQLSQSVVDFRIRSVMCVPLCNAEGKGFGVIQLDTQDRSKKFTKADLELLTGVANQAAIALENARLLQEAVAQERMRRDLEIAHEVQLSFLPQHFPEVPGYDFFAFYRAANQVGGDYYGFVPLPGGRVAVALGDVAGKGVAAALLMAKLSSEARVCFLTHEDPARALSQLNDLMAPTCMQMGRFVTLAVAVLDPARHTVTLFNAGHPSPLLYRHATRSFEECVPRKLSGYPLGIMEGHTYESCQSVLHPGDAVLIYSDGVPDAQNVRGEAFTPAGVLRALGGAPSGAPRGLVDRLVRAVEVHSAAARQNDDITLAALGRKA